MEMNRFMTFIVCMVVGTVLIMGVLVPVIADDSGSGSGSEFNNPDTDIKYSYANGTAKDFNISFSVDQQTFSTTIISNGEMVHDVDLPMFLPADAIASEMVVVVYADETKMLVMIEGFALLTIVDDVIDVSAPIQVMSSGTIVCENNTITITSEDLTDPYSFSAPSWYYYADAEGDYGRYTITQIGNLYTGNSPICQFAMDADNMVLFYLEAISADSIPTWHLTKDGNKISEAYWTYGDDNVQNAQLFILPLEISNSGGNDTVMTVVYLIPLLMIVGMVMLGLNMIFKKE